MGALPTGEIVIAHEARIEPLTAVRNTLIQSSLALLRDKGYHERYGSKIDPAILAELTTNLAPGWVDISLAEAHYRACDEMRLDAAELADLGNGVGERIRATSIVVAGKKAPGNSKDPWAIAAQLHRVWRRLYQGGSVQVVKLGQTEQLIEMRGFSLNRFHYFRHANVAAVAGTNAAVGVQVQSTRIAQYDPAAQNVAIHLTWT